MRSFKSVLFVIFIAALTVNLAGCKDDDDDKAAFEKIAGTWSYEGDPDDKYVFNADGTGAWIYVADEEYDPFTYAYDEKAGTISIFYSGGYVENYFITINGNRMYLYEDGIDDADIYVRG